MEKLTDKLIKLFSSEKVTIINVKELSFVPLNTWQYLNEGTIRYKIVERTNEYLVSITEWLEDDTFHKHLHDDANETIFVVCGEIESLLDGLSRKAFSKVSYFAKTIHSIRAKKGTVINVKFDFI